MLWHPIINKHFNTFIENKLGSIQYCDNQLLSVGWLSEHWRAYNRIILASVAKEAYVSRIKDWALENNVSFEHVKTSAAAYGLNNGYEKPEQLGVDRWLALLGAKKLYPNQSCLIVDAGTATTIDFIDEQGVHGGGWILAGVETLFKSIQQVTENVSGNDIVVEALAFGKSTNANLSHGAWAATVGMINQAKYLLAKKGKSINKIILCGGNSAHLASLLEIDVEYQPKLVFHGLSCFLND